MKTDNKQNDNITNEKITKRRRTQRTIKQRQINNARNKQKMENGKQTKRNNEQPETIKNT